MEEANRVTAYLKVTAEFYDPEATPETVRACVEQDLEDAGYEVESEHLWIPVKSRLPDAAGVPVLVTAVNTYGQKDVFEAFMGYGDFKWYTENVTRMSKKTDISCEVSEAWTVTHWMKMPEPAEDEAHDSD